MSCSVDKSCFDYGGDRSYCISSNSEGGYTVSRYEPPSTSRSSHSAYDQFDRSSGQRDDYSGGIQDSQFTSSVKSTEGEVEGEVDQSIARDLSTISGSYSTLRTAGEQYSLGVRQVQQSALQLKKGMSTLSEDLTRFSSILAKEGTLVRMRNIWQERHWQNLSTTLSISTPTFPSVTPTCEAPISRECNEAHQLMEGIRACVAEVLGDGHRNDLDEINQMTMNQFHDDYKKTIPSPTSLRGLEKLVGKLTKAYEIASCISAFSERTTEMAALCNASDYAKACHYIDEMIERDISKL